MNWKDKNVFVTGADGFIGGWIAKTLVEKGANVVVVIRDFKKENSLDIHKIRDKVTVVPGDIVNYELMSRIMNEYSIEYVFHLAAQALVGIANRSPLSTYESNIKGTWSILEAARNLKTVKGIVVASSDKAYGVQEKLPYTEEQPLMAVYPYDATKACTDILARSFAKSYNLPIAVTRNGNTYGGGDMNFSRIIPDAVVSCLNGKELIIRSDGKAERDYFYIKDAVDSYLTLAENVHRENVAGEAFNFGTETPINVLNLVKKIVKLTGKNIPVKVLGTARNEIDKQYLSISKAKRVLNWKPKYPLDKGLRETIEWYKEFSRKNRSD
jgi:CDP-glucose 4,6-dehydratase